jgi:hypothetical protein
VRNDDVVQLDLAGEPLGQPVFLILTANGASNIDEVRLIVGLPRRPRFSVGSKDEDRLDSPERRHENHEDREAPGQTHRYINESCRLFPLQRVCHGYAHAEHNGDGVNRQTNDDEYDKGADGEAKEQGRKGEIVVGREKHCG